MSLGPYIVREPGDEVDASERVIYAVFLDCLHRPTHTSIERAVLRAARRLDLPPFRVLAVVRKANRELPAETRPGAIQ